MRQHWADTCCIERISCSKTSSDFPDLPLFRYWTCACCTYAGEDAADDSSGSTEGCDDVDEMDDDDDDVSAVSRFVSGYQEQQPRQSESNGRNDSEITRLANVTRDCAVFMADFVQKIFDPS